MSFHRKARITAFVLMMLLNTNVSAAVNLDIPTVTAHDIPVMLQLTTHSAKLHGTAGSHREPLFVEAGEDTTVQPPLGNPLTFRSTWITLFHPDALPVSLVSEDYSAVAGYRSINDIPLMALETLRRHPTMFVRDVRLELASGWTALLEPRSYPGLLLDQLDRLGATPQRVARYRGYYVRFLSIIEDIKSPDRLCADYRAEQQKAAQTHSTPWIELGGLCAEPDAAARDERFQLFWQSYFRDIEDQLKRLQQRF